MTITIELPEEAAAALRGAVEAASSQPPAAALPATVAVPLRMTYAEFLDWLDEDKHAEWVNGEVIMHSPVSRRHNDVGRFLITLLQAASEEQGGLGELFYEPFQMKIGEDFPGRAPDIMFVLKENLSRVRTNLLEGPADLIVEIVSSESRGGDRGDKHYEYERGGVREYWLIDPERQTAEFYRPGADGKYALVPLDDAKRFHSAVISGLWLRPDWLWQETLPALREVLRAWERESAAV